MPVADGTGMPEGIPDEFLGGIPAASEMDTWRRWWEARGAELSAAVDRAGTPWLRMYDRTGARVDTVCMPGGYRELLQRGYAAGIISRVFEHDSLLPFYRLGYLVAYHDPGLYCPYTVSLATAVALHKYASDEVRERFLPPMLRTDEEVWQGATWMTEIRGGSDLGSNVDTTAFADGARWRLRGEKYFASNVGAELAVVAARPEGAPDGVRGLALYLVPRERADGTRNYRIRRLKDKIATRSVPTGEVELCDSEGWLLGAAEQGVYLILEVLNLSRVANAVASAALAQRALDEARAFAAQRVAFGLPVLEQPLLRAQFAARRDGLAGAVALACAAARELDAVWRLRPPYDARYHRFRLLAHLAKYWTAEFAAQTAKWAMEVHGGLGVLAEYPVERGFREAMILSIWEGTAHRQILDGLEVMQRRQAHRALLEWLAPWGDAVAAGDLRARLDAHLALPEARREAEAEAVFAELARFTADALRAAGPGAAAGPA